MLSFINTYVFAYIFYVRLSNLSVSVREAILANRKTTSVN